MSEEEKNKPALNVEKLFDPEEFSTLIINRANFTKVQHHEADLLEDYLHREHTRAERDEFLSRLKSHQAQSLLLRAIKSSGDNNTRTSLTSLCWQCGLDFSEHFLFFAEQSCSEDFTLAFESLTVMQDCHEVKQEILTQALICVQGHKSKHPELMQDVMEEIKSRIV